NNVVILVKPLISVTSARKESNGVRGSLQPALPDWNPGKARGPRTASIWLLATPLNWPALSRPAIPGRVEQSKSQPQSLLIRHKRPTALTNIPARFRPRARRLLWRRKWLVVHF